MWREGTSHEARWLVDGRLSLAQLEEILTTLRNCGEVHVVLYGSEPHHRVGGILLAGQRGEAPSLAELVLELERKGK